MKRDSSQAGKEEKKAVCWDKNKGGSGVGEKAQVVDELTKERKKGLKTKKKRQVTIEEGMWAKHDFTP